MSSAVLAKNAVSILEAFLHLFPVDYSQYFRIIPLRLTLMRFSHSLFFKCNLTN